MLIPISDFAGLIEALRSYRDRPAVVVPPRDPYGDPPVRQCPRCTRSMDNHFYGGGGNVRVDTCEPCGELWLDKAELRRITNAPDYSYQTPLYTNYSRSSDEAGEDGHQRQSESIVETIADLFGK
jgi:Zn-finger nucleic acid-binding protein